MLFADESLATPGPPFAVFELPPVGTLPEPRHLVRTRDDGPPARGLGRADRAQEPALLDPRRVVDLLRDLRVPGRGQGPRVEEVLPVDSHDVGGSEVADDVAGEGLVLRCPAQAEDREVVPARALRPVGITVGRD